MLTGKSVSTFCLVFDKEVHTSPRNSSSNFPLSLHLYHVHRERNAAEDAVSAPRSGGRGARALVGVALAFGSVDINASSPASQSVTVPAKAGEATLNWTGAIPPASA